MIFGNIFSGGSSSRGKIPILFVNDSDSPIAQMIEAKLDSSDNLRLIKSYFDEDQQKEITYNEKYAKELVVKGNYSAALILPYDFFTDTSTAIKFRILYDPKNEIETSLIQGSLQQMVMSQLPRAFPLLLQRKLIAELDTVEINKFRKGLAEAVSTTFDVNIDSVLSSMDPKRLEQNFLSDAQSDDSSSEEGNIIQGLIKFENEQVVGEEIKSPGVTRTVGGWAVMFLLFSIVGAAISLFEEKQEGSLKRLLCSPVSRTQIIWSKYIYTMLLGFIQLSVMFLFAWFVFDVDIFTNIGNLIIMIIFASAAAVSFGMIITAHTKSINQANGIATLIILIMSALGGSWFPIIFLPEWMQFIAKFTITYWSVEGFLQVLWRNASFTEILYHIGALGMMAVLANWYAIIKFKRGNIF
jgi:ABC-2 type transport system permease protein